MKNNTHSLKLAEIASWWIKNVPNTDNVSIKCAIPSLQRGAVWKVNQVELLWDSLMRGFPIGSLVISEKIKGQKSRAGEQSDKENINEEVTHHLLDGQQRSNAISLGFLDPFKVKDSKFSYLWIDLGYKADEYSNTREFLFRIVTPSHPWGYRRDDKTSRLETTKIRSFMEYYEHKPKAYEGYPHDAKNPIPFVWLIEAYEENIKEEAFWEKIKEKIECIKDIRVNYKNDIEHKSEIFESLKQLLTIQIPLLEVPKYAFTDNDISSIEHLFQRLNQQGTKLDGLELAYSMIKAYWSGIEYSFEQITPKPMADAYLAMAGVRVALIDKEKDKLPDERSIPQIRALANDEKQKSDKFKIESYLGIKEQSSDFDFKKDIKWIDNLLLHRDENTFGLPPALRTHIAHKSRDVYVLLLWIAKEFRKEEYKLTDDLKKRIIGLVTALDWFGDDKKKAVNKIYNILKSNPSEESKYDGILKELFKINDKRGIKNIISPDELDKLLNIENITDEEDIKKWSFWWQIVDRHAGKEKQDLEQKKYWDSVYIIIESRNLLLYAQREYIKEKFGKYDSLIDLWSEQNTPWDYDHILPRATLHNKKTKIEFRQIGNKFLNCIGNLQVLAFEDNRSKSDGKQDCSQKDNLSLALIEDENECKCFIKSTDDFNDLTQTKEFIQASKSRMIRIYREWWNDLEIEKLIPPSDNNKT